MGEKCNACSGTGICPHFAGDGIIGKPQGIIGGHAEAPEPCRRSGMWAIQLGGSRARDLVSLFQRGIHCLAQAVLA